MSCARLSVVRCGLRSDTFRPTLLRRFGCPPGGQCIPRNPSCRATRRADAFLDFIEHELQPLVAREFPVDDRRNTLFGQSFGGLLVLHALFTRPGLFADHVAASPSIWWNDRHILKEHDAYVGRATDARPEARVLITVGSQEQTPPPGTSAERAAMLRERRQVDASRELAADLGQLRSAGLRPEFLEFEGESHGSAVLPALQRAVERAFRVDGSARPL